MVSRVLVGKQKVPFHPPSKASRFFPPKSQKSTFNVVHVFTVENSCAQKGAPKGPDRFLHTEGTARDYVARDYVLHCPKTHSRFYPAHSTASEASGSANQTTSGAAGVVCSISCYFTAAPFFDWLWKLPRGLLYTFE